VIHRAGTELVNWYLLEEGGRVTIVDAGRACKIARGWMRIDTSSNATNGG